MTELLNGVPQPSGQQLKHGFINRTNTLTWTNTSPDRTLVISGTVQYYYQGVLRTVVNPTCQLASTTTGLWFVYFNLAGTLTSAQSFPDMETTVIAAMVWWNGSAGLVFDERHGYLRDRRWHLWAHASIGCRYGSGVSLTATGTGASASFSSISGDIWDEDINFTVPASSAFTVANAGMVWYQTSATTFTFDSTPSTVPFKWNSGTSRVRYVNVAGGYALADVDSSKYVNVWVYVSNDISQPINFFAETIATATGGYTTASSARQTSPPSLVGMGLAPEIKIIYRLVIKGDGAVQAAVAADDFRSSSPLPAGGTTIVSASSVTYSPHGNISSTNVQSAINELEDEKVSTTPSIEQKNTGYTITWAELGSVPKTFTCESGSDQVFDFAAPVAGDVGKSFRIVKDGTGAGKITIDAPATIYIEDSSSGGTIYNSASERSSITLQLVTATQLVIVAAEGTWTTT